MNFHKRCFSAMEGFVGRLQAFFSDHYPLSHYRVGAKSLLILEIYFNMGLKLAFTSWLRNSFFSLGLTVASLRCAGTVAVSIDICISQAFTSWLRNSFFSPGLIVASLRCAGTVAVSIDICISQALCLSLQIWRFEFSFWKANS